MTSTLRGLVGLEKLSMLLKLRNYLGRTMLVSPVVSADRRGWWVKGRICSLGGMGWSMQIILLMPWLEASAGSMKCIILLPCF
jgi:hypothetical protein